MLKLLILAARPKTLPVSLGPVILGLSLALSQTGYLNGLTATLTILTALLLQISTNLINDYYDGIRGIDDQRDLGPTRITASGKAPKNFIRNAFFVTLLLSLILGLYLMKVGGLPIIVIGLSSMFFAFAYTGGPLPLSYMALGELLALVFFGPVAVWGSYYIQTKSHSNIALLIGLAPGFIAAAIMAINNLRDFESDSKTKKITLAIIVGQRAARIIPLTFIFFSTFIPIIHVSVFDAPNIVLSATFTSYFFTRTWIALSKDRVSAEFNNHLASCGKYLFIFCVIYSISLNYAN